MKTFFSFIHLPPRTLSTALYELRWGKEFLFGTFDTHNEKVMVHGIKKKVTPCLVSN